MPFKREVASGSLDAGRPGAYSDPVGLHARTSPASSGRFRRWDAIFLLGLFAVVAISRFTFCETSLWEWDEILFANALHHFNVWEHSPHPPGYIGYVALTRGLNYFLHNDVKAMVFTNALFGSLLTFPLYFLYRRAAARRVALLAAALTLFNPVIWYFSETAFADITALFWAIASLALLFRYETNRSFYLGMLCMGIGMSIRQQNVLLGIVLIPLLLWRKLRQGETRAAGIGLGLLVGICLVWFVPLVWSAGGLRWYMELLRLHGQAVGSFDPGYINLRHDMSFYNFIKTKATLAWGSQAFATGLIPLTALGVGIYLWRGQRRTFLLLLLAFLPWTVVDFLWMHIDYAKYNCATIVPVSLFIVYGLLELWPPRLAWGRPLAATLSLGFIVFSAGWTFPAVRDLHSVKSPAAQLADYIRQHLNPKSDAIVFDERIRVLPPYYFSQFANISETEVDEGKIELIQHMNWYYVSGPLSGFMPQVIISAGNERLRQFGGMFFDLWLTKTDILYSNEYDSKVVDGVDYSHLIKSEAHCYLKNSGGAKILSLEGGLLPPAQHAVSVQAELDGHLVLDTQVLPKERLDRFIVFEAPYQGTGPYSVLTIKTVPSDPVDALSLEAAYWWDIELAPERQVQVIDFQPEDAADLLVGWLPPEKDGELTVARSEGTVSVLAVPMKPEGIYELSFRLLPTPKIQDPMLSETVSVCLGDVCSPWIELVNGQWSTYTRLVLSPATRAEEKVELTFYYKLATSPAVTATAQDPGLLGITFDYVKLAWLGNRPVAAASAQAK